MDAPEHAGTWDILPARGHFVHLYLNGLYWGVYNLCENPGPDLAGRANPNAATGFDVRKASKMEAGD